MFDLDRWHRIFARPSFIVAHDLVLALLSFWAACAVVHNGRLLSLPGLAEKSLAFTFVCAVSFYIFSVFRGSWRYVSVPELASIIRGAGAAVLVYAAGAFVLSRRENLPPSALILTMVFIIVALSASRILYRLIADGRGFRDFGLFGNKQQTGRPVVVCGLTSEAEGFVRATHRSRQIMVVGIIDRSGRLLARSIQGVPVLGKPGQLNEIVARFAVKGIKIKELVIAEHSPDRNRLGELLKIGTNAGLRVTRLPEVMEMASITSGSLFEPMPIELSDLLGRPENTIDLDKVARLIEGKTVLITGAGGSIGSELSRQVAELNPRQFIITDSAEFNLYSLDMELREQNRDLNLKARILDVRDPVRIRGLFDELRPDVIFHAAALKHVPLVEQNPLDGIMTNVLGTRNVADAAMEAGVSTFVMISTDKAVNPTNVMGATKRAAESYVQSLDVHSKLTRFKTVRFGNVLGSNGSVVPRFKAQIASGGPVTVTHPEVTRYFMTTPEAVRLVLQASALSDPKNTRGTITVLDMGKPVRVVNLAERMIELAGFRPYVDIDITFSGLRPGEKLFEELLDAGETLHGHSEEGYFVASPRVIDHSLLLRTINAIDKALASGDAPRAIELLCHIVPEYQRSAELLDYLRQRPAPRFERSGSDPLPKE